MLALLQAIGPATSTPRLGVAIVFDGTPISPKLEASAIEEARLIWARYGVDIHACGRCDVGTGRDVTLAVTLVDYRPPNLGTKALGSIQFVDGVPEPAIAIYPNAIASLVSTVEIFGMKQRAWPAAFRDVIVGRALGRALAHEIGHFLLRTRQHSKTGLMQALQPVRNLVDRENRRFALSAHELTSLERYRRFMPISDGRTD